MPHHTIPALLAAAILAAAPLSLAAPPTDAQIDAAVAAFEAKERVAIATGGEFKPAERIQWADDSLDGIDLSELSSAQAATLLAGRILPDASKSREVFARLSELASADDVSGAEAAALRLSLMRYEPDPSAQQLLLRRALTHPALHDALRQGRGYSMFMALRMCRANLLPEVKALADVFTPDLPPEVAARAHLTIDVILALEGDEDTQAREPMRLKLLEMVRAAQKQDIPDENLRKALASAEKKLDGAFMRGALLNNPAPALDFAWVSPGSSIAKATSLADLKGRVVVLDFWATWCGPCIASFTDVRKLQAHYDGYPVVILGVTSPQGIQIADGKTIDCKGNPELEYSLMPDYMKDKGMTWPVVFTAQEVFNPEYGVNAIPHVVIIDPKGNVRHRALHPNSKVVSLARKAELIDALLKEAGLPTPPPLPVDK